MKHVDTHPSTEHQRLLRQIQESSLDEPGKSLFMDDIFSLARMRLICFDPQGELQLTDKGRAALNN